MEGSKKGNTLMRRGFCLGIVRGGCCHFSNQNILIAHIILNSFFFPSLIFIYHVIMYTNLKIKAIFASNNSSQDRGYIEVLTIVIKIV